MTRRPGLAALLFAFACGISALLAISSNMWWFVAAFFNGFAALQQFRQYRLTTQAQST